VDVNAVFETFVFGGMRALMTNIPQVDIWAEAEAFFPSVTDADIALRTRAPTDAAACGRTRKVSSPSAVRLQRLRTSR